MPSSLIEGHAGATNAGEFQHFVEELWKVYDLKNDKKLDIYDDNWLSKVMGS